MNRSRLDQRLDRTRDSLQALLRGRLNRLPLYRPFRRMLAAVSQLLTHRGYARALISLSLDRLPLGWGADLRRTCYVWSERVRRTRAGMAHRSYIRDYSFDEEQQRAFALILDRLELTVPPDKLLAVLRKRMMLSEWNGLVALLDFVARTHSPQCDHRGAAIVNASDLGPRACRDHRRRNILFITGEFPNRMHGGGGRLMDFIKIMSRDNDIYLYSWFDGRDDAATCQELAAYCKKMTRVHFGEFEGSLERLREFVGDVPMDIVHYEWPRSLTNYDPAWGKHHVFTYMEVVSLRLRMDLTAEPPLSNRWFSTLIEVLGGLQVEIVNAAKADSHIVVTRKDGEFLSRFTPNRLYLILNHGVNLDEFCLPEQSPEPHTLVFTGNFLHYPNEDAVRFFFDKIFGDLQARIPDVRVYLVGVNPSRRIWRYHDNRHVFVTGAVDDIRPYIQRATVCIAPLISGAGLRSKVIQYAALKRACVATSVAATDLLFEDGKDIFIADDPRVFAERVLYLLERPDAARQMAESAFEQVRMHYDNRNLVGDLYRVYENLENSQSPRRNAHNGNTYPE